jgi:hypothetical protein
MVWRSRSVNKDVNIPGFADELIEILKAVYQAIIVKKGENLKPNVDFSNAIETAFFESQFFRTDFTWTYSGKTLNENILLRDSQLVEKVRKSSSGHIETSTNKSITEC